MVMTIFLVFLFIRNNRNNLRGNELWIMERSYNRYITIYDEISNDYLNNFITKLNDCEIIKNIILSNSTGIIQSDSFNNELIVFLGRNPFFYDQQDIFITELLDEEIKRLNSFLSNYEDFNYEKWISYINTSIQERMDKEAENSRRIRQAIIDQEQAARRGERAPLPNQRNITNIDMSQPLPRISRRSQEDIQSSQENSQIDWEIIRNEQIENQISNWPSMKLNYISQLDDLASRLSYKIESTRKHINDHRIFLYNEYKNIF